MRVPSVLLALFFMVGAATAQEPHEPVGNLAQVMRAILFPNSNLLYDVQSGDPEEMGKADGGSSVSSTFSGIYKGWDMVEQTRARDRPGFDAEGGGRRVPGPGVGMDDAARHTDTGQRRRCGPHNCDRCSGAGHAVGRDHRIHRVAYR